MHTKNMRGSNTTAALFAIGAVILIGGLYYAIARPAEDDAMMDTDDAMTANTEAQMNEAAGTLNDDVMMESGNVAEDGDGDGMMQDEKTSMMQEILFSGSVIAGTSAPLLDYTEADYKKAVASDNLVVLYFYANWCPICKEEVASALYPYFNELQNEDVVGFRVNFNDNETDTSEQALAREFGVAYQHTKVFVKNGERLLKSPESWNQARYAEEVAKAL